MRVAAALFMASGAGYMTVGAIGAYSMAAEGNIPSAVLSAVTILSGVVIIISGIRLWRMS